MTTTEIIGYLIAVVAAIVLMAFVSGLGESDRKAHHH